ncbi:MAG: IPT/TIG domain-containing protein, partial [Patescibacteria group bacterium]
DIASKGVQGYTTVPPNFTVVDSIDFQNPTIGLISGNTQICLDSDNNISANASDDSGVSDVTYGDSHDGSAFVGDKVKSASPYEITWRPTEAKGYKAMSSYTISGQATDVVGRTANSSLTKTLRAEHCCNGVQDADETGVDYGGQECAAGPGAVCRDAVTAAAQCSQNNDACATGVCALNSGGGNCVCQSVPIIDWVSPVGGFCQGKAATCREDNDCGGEGPCDTNTPNGAPGNLITIGGRFFGMQAGSVYFKCNIGSGCTNGIVQARLANSVNSACGNIWSNNIIVAVVPPNAVSGPIGVADAAGNYDRTDYTENQRGPVIPDFIVNNIQRPGLCQVLPAAAEPAAPISLNGIQFGGTSGDMQSYVAEHVRFGSLSDSVPSALNNGAWGTGSIAAFVPNLAPGATSVFITNTTNIPSNVLSFTVQRSTRAPFITRIDPSVGHAGDYITIYGGNFGSSRGSVKFGDTDADFSFPAECPAQALWQDSQIIVKVPASLADGSYTIKVTAGGLEGELANAFRFGNYCEGNASASCVDDSACGRSGKCITSAKPGLCAITPDNGPVNTQVTFLGERFGSSRGTLKFNSVSAVAPVADTATIQGWLVNRQNAADRAVAAVPTDTRTGPANVVSSAGVESNSLNFQVGSCLGAANVCTNTQTCCGAATQYAGSCRETADACGLVASRTYAQYYFEFSTAGTGGTGGGGDFLPPTVIEECNRALNNCNTRDLPSPSPLTPLPSDWNTRTPARTWTDNGANLACVNAVITARFDKLIDRNTLVVSGQNKTIIVNKCDNAGNNCNSLVENSSVSGKEFAIS